MDIHVNPSLPDEIIQVAHAGGTTYWNVRTDKSVTFAHPTVAELCEQVQFVPTTATGRGDE